MSTWKVSPKGIYNAACDICGFVYKSNELKKNYRGMMVCKEDWEPRHILDFYTVAKDNYPIPFTRPDTDGTDIGPTINPLTTTTPAPR